MNAMRGPPFAELGVAEHRGSDGMNEKSRRLAGFVEDAL